MTSFSFHGPAIGGPAHGRTLVSHTKLFVALYRVQCDSTNQQAQPLIKSQHLLGTFRYQAHSYGQHQFFLPAGQTLEYFLRRWNPPTNQNEWPSFLQHLVQTFRRTKW